MRTKKFLAMAIALGLAVGMTAMPTLAAEKKTLVFGDTTFNAENEEADINPQNTYAGWACIRYGVGETLFRYSDTMEIEPWIAKEYENIDELTWKITLNDGVVFSNGRACDGEAVKESLEALVANHERAAGDLCIDTIEADGNTVTIKTTEPKPALINYLSDPYGCIIDMQAGISDDGIVIGTGPYVATELVTDDHVNLVKNENYWNGDVNVDEITVRTISDGDTLAFALQAGEINAAYGMAYASYPLFENDDFTFKVTITGIDGTYSTNVAGKTITNGTETEFTLRHGETFVVKNLPENASYTVVETDKKGYQKTEVSVNKEANQTSDTAEGTIRMDGENTVDYTNTKTVPSPTGIALEILPFAVLFLAAIAGGVVFFRRKRG